MSDDVDVTFGMGDAARIDRSVMYTERVVIGNPTPPRRYYSPDAGGGGSGGGGTGGGGCSCCDCTQCLNMCAQNATDVIQTCSACTVAPKRFAVSLGSVLGTQTFVYVSGCNWETANFTVYYVYPTGAGGATAGVYKGTFVEAGASSTLTITYVSGTDTLKLSTARQLSWKPDPDKSWSCICNMTMIPSVSPEKFPPNLFVPCEACVAPVDASGSNGAAWAACHVNAGCVASLTLPDFTSINRSDPNSIAANWTAVIAKQSAESCCFVTITNGSGLAACPSYNDYCSYNKIIDNFPADSFFWHGGVCVTQDGFGAYWLNVTIGVTTGITDPIEGGIVGEGQYRIAVTSLVSGSNAVSFVSSTGSLTWPGTYDIEIFDCSFGSINHDYGYGCGNGSGSCTGLCPAVSAVGASPTGFVWTFAGAPASNCVGASCICQTIPQITALFGYPSGLGATAEAPCVSS